MTIPVIINNRNLLTWPKAMVEKISTYEDVGDVIIIDNDSTYIPLLEWYNTNPCTIKKVSNLGHTAPWLSGIVDKLNSEYYIVTDSDLGLDGIPLDVIPYLIDKMNHLNIDKIGLGLNWQIVKEEALYYNWMQTHEKNRWASSQIKNDIYLDIPIDTTFALYEKKNYFIGGASTTFPYVARHFPWEMTKEEYNDNEEFKYYIKEATNSSSFKQFLKL